MLLQITTVLVTAGAGLAGAAAAAAAAAPATASTASAGGAQEIVEETDLRFVRSSELQNAPVTSPEGDELGTVEDLVLDPGSGELRYLVIERGGVGGLGATSLALPWSQLVPVEPEPGAGEPGTPPRAGLVAHLTPQQLDRMPEFDPADPGAVQSQAWVDAMRGAFPEWADWSEADRADPFAGALESAAETTIEGEIVRVRRLRGFEAAEHIIVEVRTGDGRATAALGPAWLVMGGAHPPMRGIEISIEAFETDRGGGIEAVAKRYTIEDSETVLRGDDGAARWRSPASSGEQKAQDSAGRLVLASEIAGSSATAQGKDAGKIQRLVIEQVTGVVAFVEIDPDANFLGLAETTRLAPWEALATVSAGRIRLDASPQTLTTAPESPERAESPAWFADEANRHRVYEHFQFEPRRFATRGKDGGRDGDPGGG